MSFPNRQSIVGWSWQLGARRWWPTPGRCPGDLQIEISESKPENRKPTENKTDPTDRELVSSEARTCFASSRAVCGRSRPWHGAWACWGRSHIGHVLDGCACWGCHRWCPSRSHHNGRPGEQGAANAANQSAGPRCRGNPLVLRWGGAWVTWKPLSTCLNTMGHERPATQCWYRLMPSHSWARSGGV